MTLALCGMVLGAVGPGSWSVDEAIDIVDEVTGVTGLLIAAGAGVGGAALLLATSWRPPKSA
jgi:putative oxidoreductase